MRITARKGCWLLSRKGYTPAGHGPRQFPAAFFASVDDAQPRETETQGQPSHPSGMLGGRVGDRKLQRKTVPSDFRSHMRSHQVEHGAELGGNSAPHDRVNSISPNGLSNRHVIQLCEEGRLDDAFSCLNLLLDHGSTVETKTYECLIQACTTTKAWKLGQQVHDHIVKSGVESHMYIAGNLVRMYSSFGRMAEAQGIFDRMEKRNPYSWTALIRGYVEDKQYRKALKCFEQMINAMVRPSAYVFVFVLRACVMVEDLELGQKIHAQTKWHGLETDAFVGTSIVDMYAKLGDVKDARAVFDKMPKRSLVCWTAMIGGCVNAGLPREAILLYKRMLQEGTRPDSWVLASVVNACGNIPALEEGKQLHADIIKSGVELDVILRTSLVDMYAKCGDIQRAREIFDNLPRANVVSWTAMIVGYMQIGRPDEVVKLYKQMQDVGIKPNTLTYTSVLKACANLRALEEGRRVHADVISNGLGLDITMGNSLVDMYANCGSMTEACGVFEKMPSRSVVSWTSLLAGYTEAGLVKDAISFCERMWQTGEKPDAVAFSCILKACASVQAVEQGKRVHALIVSSGLESDLIVGNAVVYMYAKCGYLEDAVAACEKIAKRDAVSWYSVIAGYTHHGRAEEAIKLYHQMLDEGIRPNSRVITKVLHACARTGGVKEGRKVHSDILESGLELDVYMGSALVQMYAKCGTMEDARKAFEAMGTKNVVVWTVMMEACLQNGLPGEAAILFERMQQEGIKPDPTAISRFSSELLSSEVEGSS